MGWQLGKPARTHKAVAQVQSVLQLDLYEAVRPNPPTRLLVIGSPKWNDSGGDEQSPRQTPSRCKSNTTSATE